MRTPCPRDASFTTYEEFARRYQAYYESALDEDDTDSEDGAAAPEKLSCGARYYP